MRIQIDDSRFIEASQKLKNTIIVSSAIQAANRTIGNMKSEAVRFLREDIKIKPRDKDRIFQTISATRANSAQAQLVVTPKPVALINLKPKVKTVMTNQGERQSVSVLFKGRRRTLADGFMAQLKSGHEGIFRRVGNKRLPIKEMFSWIGQDVFRNRDTLVKELQDLGEERFQFHFISRFDYFVEKELGDDVIKK